MKSYSVSVGVNKVNKFKIGVQRDGQWVMQPEPCTITWWIGPNWVVENFDTWIDSEEKEKLVDGMGFKKTEDGWVLPLSLQYVAIDQIATYCNEIITSARKETAPWAQPNLCSSNRS